MCKKKLEVLMKKLDETNAPTSPQPGPEQHKVRGGPRLAASVRRVTLTICQCKILHPHVSMARDPLQQDSRWRDRMCQQRNCTT